MTEPPRTLVVWCPDWAVTASGRRADELIAVVASQRVIAASPAARAYGVRTGQRRREAQSCCPGLDVLARDPGGEVRAFEPVVRALEELGVPVAVRQPGWAALHTRGPARRLGGERGLRDAVASLLAARLDPPAWRVGLADGPFAATLAAQIGADGAAQPDGGAGIVPRHGNAKFLAPLAVERLGRPELADLLRRLGITTLGAFARLAEEDVLARFGPEGAHAHQLARGLDEPRLDGRRIPPDLAVEATLDPPAQRVDEAAFVARTLATSLCGQLAERGLACNRIAVEVTLSGGESLRRVWDHDGAWGPALVAERLRWQLEAWLTAGRSRRGAARASNPAGDGEEAVRVGGVGPDGSELGRRDPVPPGGGVERVRLAPLEVTPDQGRQASLWSRPSAGEERVLRVAARLQGMLGVDAVLRPVLVGGRGPVDRVRLVPFGDPLPQVAPAPWPGCLPSPSPSVIFAYGDGAAEEAELLDDAGERVGVDGRGALNAAPRLLVTQRGEVVVTAWAGPWPADERWWDGTHHRRRARLQLLTAGGEAYLASLERGRWRLEGIYD
jgi:protein ImuB